MADLNALAACAAAGVTATGSPTTGGLASFSSSQSITTATASAGSKILGSADTGGGAPYSELTLGAGLSITGSTLNASGSVGTLPTEYTNSNPSAPSTGTTLFSRRRANITKLAQIGIAGLDEEVQNSLGSMEIFWIEPQFNGNGVTAMGIAATTSTTAAVLPSQSSQFSSYRRIDLNASGTNAFAQVRGANAFVARGATTTRGGFYAVIRFGVESTVANSRLIAGFWGGSWAGNADPSSATDAFMFAKDSGDSNIQVMYNDSTGLASKIDLGASFPANTSAGDFYEGRLYCPPGGVTMYYWIKDLISGAETSGSVNTNLPTATTYLNGGVWSATGATGGTHSVAFASLYVETGAP